MTDWNPDTGVPAERQLAVDLVALHNEGLITLTAVEGDEFVIEVDELDSDA